MTIPQPRPAGDLSGLKIQRDRKSDDSQDSQWKRAAVWTVVAILIAVLAVFGYQRGVAPRRAPVVETMTVKRSLMIANAPTLTATGYLVADRQSSISPKLSGRVIRLGFDTGSFVRRGDVLAVLESTQLAAQLSETRASYEEAAREYRRQDALWKAGVTSKALLDGAEAQLSVARARVEQVNVALRDSVIRAPFDGTITSKNVELGEVVSPLSMGQVPGSSTGGGSIATLADLRTLEVEADVSEGSLGTLRVGQPAEIAVDAFPGQKWGGKLRQIVPTADRAKGVVKVKVAIINPSDRLLPEMSSSVSFLQSERTASELSETPKLWIPSSAVISASELTRVAVTRNDRVELRSVTTGQTRENRVEIVSGLREGEVIVSSGGAELEDGQRIRTSK